jgi:hypothetical protein
MTRQVRAVACAHAYTHCTDVVLPVARPIVYPQVRAVGGGSLPLLEQTGEVSAAV